MPSRAAAQSRSSKLVCSAYETYFAESNKRDNKITTLQYTQARRLTIEQWARPLYRLFLQDYYTIISVSDKHWECHGLTVNQQIGSGKGRHWKKSTGIHKLPCQEQEYEEDYQWRIQGGRAPLFLAKSILFFTLYTMSGKNIFEIEFGFYSGRNPRSFWKYGRGGCMRVCVNRNRSRYCFLFCKGPILNDIRGHSDSKNICQIA